MSDGLSLFDLLDELNTHGECRFDPELHTGPDAFTIEPLAHRMAREDAAREVCAGCSVRDVCLAYALQVPSLPESGIWAGHTAGELAELAEFAEAAQQAPALGEVA